MGGTSPIQTRTGVRQHAKRRPALVRYALAVTAVVLGWAARDVMSSGVGPTALPFIFFFPAVAIAAWFGGGLLSIALSALAANWFFVEPIHAFSVKSAYDFIAVLAFVFASLVIVAAIQMMHRARARLAYAHDLLATTVAS